ncbi:MAG: hypothetical protein K2K32_06290 [Muribaculaceae bacterium]|nr:hypothetical protein [Muribaculaceae bacterium]
MKKSFLLSMALAATCSVFAAGVTDLVSSERFVAAPMSPAVRTFSQTRATESIELSYANGAASGLKLNGMTGGVSRAYMLFEMKPEDIKRFAGNQVTGFTVVSPFKDNTTLNSITSGRFFYTTDLAKEEYTQDFSLSEIPFEFNEIAIDTPYTITGEETSLYFGYSVVVPPNDDMYYLVIDGVKTSYEGAGLFGSSEDGKTFPDEFYSFSSAYGALSMAITIAGDNLPKSSSFNFVPSAICLPLGEAFSVPVTILTTNGSPIESVDIDYTLNGEPQTSHYVFPTPIPAGFDMILNAAIEFPAQASKFQEDVQFTLSKVNGEENVAEGNTASATVVVVNEVPVHQTLYEEYTSLGCGFCTRGFAALEYIRENYPDFVTASFHTNYNGVTDAMKTVSSFPTNVPSFPSAVLNRNSIVDPYFGTETYNLEVPVVGDIMMSNLVPTVWNVKVSHVWESDSLLTATAEVANVMGYTNKTYKVAYLLVADGITGTGRNWIQSNYYNTYAPDYVPQLNQFCRGGVNGKSSIMGLVFNDVVISDNGIKGVTGSIPTDLAAEEWASHSLTFDLSKIKSTLTIDKNKLRVIAAVVDSRGNVLNCAKDEVNDYVGAAVDRIVDDNAPVEYFNINGQKVADPSNGIFIRRQGNTTTKVIIR